MADMKGKADGKVIKPDRCRTVQMNIINIEHISKLFGDKLIFDDASFGLQEGDKVGIVGINGTGKSTLLRMAAGEVTPDSGQIIRQNNLKMAYLPQTPEFPKGCHRAVPTPFPVMRRTGQVQSNLVQLGITGIRRKTRHPLGRPAPQGCPGKSACVRF